jgi:transcriptional regulator with XRE-family HTH domain
MQNFSHLFTQINDLAALLVTALLAIWQEVRDARRKRGWTIEDAAEALGVDTSTYQRWESGTQTPHPANLARITQVFDLADVTICIRYDLTRERQIDCFDRRVTLPAIPRRSLPLKGTIRITRD